MKRKSWYVASRAPEFLGAWQTVRASEKPTEHEDKNNKSSRRIYTPTFCHPSSRLRGDRARGVLPPPPPVSSSPPPLRVVLADFSVVSASRYGNRYVAQKIRTRLVFREAHLPSYIHRYPLGGSGGDENVHIIRTTSVHTFTSLFSDVAACRQPSKLL